MFGFLIFGFVLVWGFFVIFLLFFFFLGCFFFGGVVQCCWAKHWFFSSGPYLCCQWRCSIRRWTWIHRLWVLSPFKILGRFRKSKNAELHICYLILFGKAWSGMASALLCFFWSMYLFWLSKAWIAFAKILHFLAKVQWQMASFTRCNI